MIRMSVVVLAICLGLSSSVLAQDPSAPFSTAAVEVFSAARIISRATPCTDNPARLAPIGAQVIGRAGVHLRPAERALLRLMYEAEMQTLFMPERFTATECAAQLAALRRLEHELEQ